MTSEEIIEKVESEIIEKVESEIIELADKALEQEPCEDCISRKLLSDNICEGISCNECSFNEIDDESGCLLQKRLDELPSVQPKPKTGHWIKVTNGRGGHECDLCHEYAPSYQSGEEHLTNYCPNCGAKMIEPQESEE